MHYLHYHFFKNDLEITKDENKELTKEISSKLTNFNFYKDNINDTHIEFNKNLLKFLSSQNIFSFLRKSFIQQMFLCIIGYLFLVSFNILKDLQIGNFINF